MDTSKYENLVPKVFLFVDRRCFPDWEIGRSLIDFHDLTFILEGQADYYINGEKFTVKAGDMLYAPPGSIREARTCKESPMHSYAFNFFWEGPDNPIRLPFETVTRNWRTKEILEDIREFSHVWMGKQPLYRMKSRAIFQLIVYRLLSIAHHHQTPILDPRVHKVMAYIMDHYAEDVTIADLAQGVGLNPVYLGKLFKQNTGLTCKEFMNKVRVNNAEMILSAGGFNVSEVAEHCGYHDVAYFSNVFKNIKGYPPSSALK
ncbi:AraC family transcriptional regulator [Paenibacillus helianthi]|uniref:AraC family transcriptional regulator n=1 Tax=Paenibacillus helianthi TaxID=1349432 RepID=A0ABX3EMJ7_9BACL|nr:MULTISPECIES: helix-turn-helix domain-containing protein [Paenibacillus]OKP79551.1 AraC family transcriptional regulator [Paenibacillus sp. P3E]OKP85439.1 AraC family transcriptional regulator [Paenibacillus helianthi]